MAERKFAVIKFAFSIFYISFVPVEILKVFSPLDPKDYHPISALVSAAV